MTSFLLNLSGYSAIENLLSVYSDVLNASDVSKIVALFTDDGILMPNGAPLSNGQEELKLAYAALYKACKLDVQFTTDEVIVNGDNAFARTLSIGSTRINASGNTIPMENKELFVLKKHNGQWKITNYIFNNNEAK